MNHFLPLKSCVLKFEYYCFCKFYICQCLRNPTQHPTGSRKERSNHSRWQYEQQNISHLQVPGMPPAARALGPQVSHTTGLFNAHFIMHFSNTILVSQISLMDWDVVAVKLSTLMGSMIWMTCRSRYDVVPVVERWDLTKERQIVRGKAYLWLQPKLCPK